MYRNDAHHLRSLDSLCQLPLAFHGDDVFDSRCDFTHRSHVVAHERDISELFCWVDTELVEDVDFANERGRGKGSSWFFSEAARGVVASFESEMMGGYELEERSKLVGR